jgi:hypothetical protein
MDYVSISMAMVASLGAAISAWFAWRAVRTTARVAEAAIVLRLMDDYASTEMLNSLRILRRWKTDHGEDFSLKWINSVREKDEIALQVDVARRHVKNYYIRIDELYRLDL